jgi:hypothetical protein
MNKIIKCSMCKFHIKKPVSTNYILSFCLKFDTFASIARNNENLCGPEFRKYVDISKSIKK